MGRTGRISTYACCLGIMLLIVGAASAPGHQTKSNKGVSVTMHVTPDDEPVSGQSSRIIVTKVRAGSWRFSRKRCACYLRISDSAGDVVLNRRVSQRTTRFTFPRATAYEIVFTGRVTRGSKTKRFRVSFAIRAS
jgi:hypothetical protein